MSEENRPDDRKRRKKRAYPAVLLSVLFLLGCGISLYPVVSDFWNFHHQGHAAIVYEEAVRTMGEADDEKMLDAARMYNESLGNRESRFCPTEEEDAYYRTLLAVGRTDVMAVLEIPSIHVYLPVYHGTEEDTLQAGIGHLEGSSLPIGGSGTHAVLSGHRGLPSARLLSDLNLMKEGDRFRIHVLGHVLVYETDRIETVLPSEMESLEIEAGEDYVTLLTCTPYGINTHRLLVRGRRVEGEEAEEVGPDGESGISYRWKPGREEILILLPLPVLAVVMVMMLKAPTAKRQKGAEKGERRSGDDLS